MNECPRVDAELLYKIDIIRITCPCDLYPLTPHFYIVKLGFTRVFIFFLIFALKHRLWVLIFERVPKIYVLSKNSKEYRSTYTAPREKLEKYHIFCI